MEIFQQGYALIALENPHLAKTCEYFVRRYGLEAVVVKDGLSAMNELKIRGTPGLVLTEISLPKVDGFQLLQALREQETNGTAPAIVISAFIKLRTEAFRQKSALGIAAILPQTVSFTTLQRTLERVLSPQTVVLKPAVEMAEFEAEIPNDVIAPSRTENERLAAIVELGLEKDGSLDDSLQLFVAGVARAFDVPIALVSIVLEDEQWFKAYFGLSGELLEKRGTPREISFCTHVVDADPPQPMVVPNAKTNPAFRDNPLVISGAIGGYVGAPLITSSGAVIGTLCLIDYHEITIDE